MKITWTWAHKIFIEHGFELITKSSVGGVISSHYRHPTGVDIDYYTVPDFSEHFKHAGVKHGYVRLPSYIKSLGL